MPKRVVTDDIRPSVNGSVNSAGDLEILEITAAEDLAEHPVRTEEIVNLADIYVDPDEDRLSDIAVRLPARVDIVKPAKNAWVTVCPDPATTCIVVMYEDTSQARSTTYLVAGRALKEEMCTRFGAKKRRLYLAQDNNKRLFLWPLGLPSSDGSINSWTQSSEQAVAAAKSGWVHVVANRLRQEYDIELAKPDIIPDPQWPAESFDDIVRRAVRGLVLVEGDNPILRRLREGA